MVARRDNSFFGVSMARGVSLRTVVAAVVAALVVVVAPATVAGAAPSQGYAEWTVDGGTASWAGSGGVADVPGFPSMELATNSTSVQQPSGSTVWLGPTTPFGAVFGSSQNKEYLTLRTTTSQAPSTTTISFDVPTPVQSGGSGWGFALGDVDADIVTVSATAPDGTPLTAAQLGWQSAFNYCNVSPKPSGCPGGTSTDVPTWDPATQTLTGSGSDTDGAAGWFRPTVPVATLTLGFAAITGFPVYQLWIATSGSIEIAGTVTLRVDGAVVGPVAGAEVALLDGEGNAVTIGGVPVVATTGTDGSYSFAGLVPRSDYQVRVVDPDDPDEVQTLAVDASGGSVTDADLVFDQVTPPTTTTTSTTSTTVPVPTTSTTSTTVPVPTTSTTVPVPTTSTTVPVPTTSTTSTTLPSTTTTLIPPTPASTSTTSPTTSVVPGGDPRPPAPGGGVAASSRGTLPATGVGSGGLVAVGVPLVALGLALGAVTRRRSAPAGG